MSINIGVELRYSININNDILPGNWIEMDNKTKDTWVREWIEQEEPIILSNVIFDHGDITWHEAKDERAGQEEEKAP